MSLTLNSLKPAEGSRTKKVRVGRGIGSGLGKTCGRGVKGQGARKSGNVRPGFEGGQMPLKIRVPKFGFTSRLKATTGEVGLKQAASVECEVLDLDALKKADLVPNYIKRVKIVNSRDFKLEKALKIKGLAVTKSVLEAVKAAGGSVEEPAEAGSAQ